MKRFTPIFLLLSVISLNGVLIAAEQHETITREFIVNGPGMLVVDSDSGSIEVEGTSGSKVNILLEIDWRTADAGKIEKAKNDMHLDFNSEDNQVMATLDYEKSGGWFSGSKMPKLKWVIQVPNQFSTDLNTGGGSIEIQGLEGVIEGRTSGGHIKVAEVKGEVSVRTSGGHISCHEIEGNMELRTSGGAIQVSESDGQVMARTSGGHIELATVRGLVDARTSGGHIDATLIGPLVGDCVLRTSGGGINIVLDDAVEADLYASTSAGRVNTNVPILLDGDVKSNRVVGQIGEGGHSLQLQTSAGSIQIRKADS